MRNLMRSAIGITCILSILSFMSVAPAIAENAAGKTRSCTLIDYNSPTIGAGITHIIALKEDGTVQIAQSPYWTFNASGWTNIKAVAANEGSIVGLREDGTVLSQGMIDGYRPIDTSNWANIKAIAAGDNHVVGLRIDGTVIVDGYLDDATAEEISGGENRDSDHLKDKSLPIVLLYFFRVFVQDQPSVFFSLLLLKHPQLSSCTPKASLPMSPQTSSPGQAGCLTPLSAPNPL